MGAVGNQDDSESDSFPTDSEEDVNGEIHTLNRIAQALHNKEPVTAIIVGEFTGYQDRLAQCEFRLDYEGKAPTSLLGLLLVSLEKLFAISQSFGGTSIPGSLTWTRNPNLSENLVFKSGRFGRGLKVTLYPRDLTGAPMLDYEASFVVDFPYGLSIAFPAAPNLTDMTLMQYFATLTASWDGKTLSNHWSLYLDQKPWRK
jgi:hypothetical protein